MYYELNFNFIYKLKHLFVLYMLRDSQIRYDIMYMQTLTTKATICRKYQKQIFCFIYNVQLAH